jgi:hypothetical protein
MRPEQRRLESVKAVTTALAAWCSEDGLRRWAMLLAAVAFFNLEVIAANLCFSSGELIDCIISLRSSGLYCKVSMCAFKFSTSLVCEAVDQFKRVFAGCH